jgi:hypothetical protein
MLMNKIITIYQNYAKVIFFFVKSKKKRRKIFYVSHINKINFYLSIIAIAPPSSTF